MTRPIIQNLMRDGYQTVQWDSGNSRHSVCRDLNRQQWHIDDFISGLHHDAPMFEKSHPGDESCSLIISGPGLPDIQLDSYGDMDEAIGTSKPMKAPTPQPKVKTLAPKPQEKVVEKPVAPKQKIVYVPEGVHKQIKDPFEKEKLTPEQYEEWLKDLEKENVEESMPAYKKPTEEEIEEWQRGLERETSQKIPQWLTGLFKDKL